MVGWERAGALGAAGWSIGLGRRCVGEKMESPLEDPAQRGQRDPSLGWIMSLPRWRPGCWFCY